MAQVHASSRKRTKPSDVSQSGDGRPCLSRGYSPEYIPKRPRLEPKPTGPTSHSNAVSLSTTSSFVLLGSNFSNIHTQPDGEIDLPYDGSFAMFLPSPSLVFQQHPDVYDQISPHQDVSIASNAAGTPATYTMTNGTFSPESLNKQSLLDPHDCVYQSPDGGSEVLYAGSDDFHFGLGDELQLNESNANYPIFGDLDGFDLPDGCKPAIDMENSFPSSYLEPFPVMSQGDGQSQFVHTTIGGLNSYSPPWVYTPLLTSGIIDSASIGFPQRMPISTKASPPVIPRTPQPKPIQPSKEGSIMSSDSIWCQITYGSLSPRQSPVQRLEMKPPRKQGCRDGSLNPITARHARDMREVGSCWQCRLSRVTCSLGDPCERCSKQSSKPSLPPKVCYRAKLPDYWKVFNPDLVCSRLNEPAVSEYIRKTAIFTNNTIDIEMLSGPNYPKILLRVTEFRVLSQESLALDLVAPREDTEEQCFKFIPSYAPPLGLNGASARKLRSICMDHIKAIIEMERDEGEANYGDTSLISWNAFEAVNRYRRASGDNCNSGLLKKAAMLHAMFYFMSRVIIFTKESAEKAVEGLRKPHTLNFAKTVSSTLLDLQMKQAMQGVLSETTQAVLEKLEKTLSKCKSKRAYWADIFCVVLILCICIEAVQVASDSYAMAALREDPGWERSRAHICRELDERLFKDITELFHMAYKTPKASRKSRVGFNPIRNGVMVDEDGITPQMVKLFHEIRQIIATHGDKMVQIAEDPSFDPKPDLLTHHMAFRKRNSGRLVSKFLRSFI